ncbi:MAG: metalloprotease [Brevundimonas sp.]|uniref:metalloprotease n=1 Tax=Brevundimonas sp. TaxID=1871086 RepID=UPI0040331E3D
MTDETTGESARPRGPWDPDPNAPPAPKVTERRLGPISVRVERTAKDQPQGDGGRTGVLDKGQSPVWAILSTLLLGGFLWWMTGSLIVVLAALFGLLVHEYGHVLAMNRYGMGPARIYIIPFLGGLAKGQRPPTTEWHGVLVSLAGPAFGLIAVLPLLGIWYATGQSEWLIGAFFVALINLVNMAPAPPLDGSHALGPVLARVHPMLEKAALITIGGLVVVWGLTTGRWILAVFLALSLLGQLQRGNGRSSETPLTGREAGLSLLLYLVTAAACVAVALGTLLPLSNDGVSGALETGLRVLNLDRFLGTSQ